MRVALTSDLHVEHHPDVIPLVAERVRELAPDVLIVAGDVSPTVTMLESALQALKQAAPRLVFVPGNHDLWCGREGSPTSRERYETIIPAACARITSRHRCAHEPRRISHVLHPLSAGDCARHLAIFV